LNQATQRISQLEATVQALQTHTDTLDTTLAARGTNQYCVHINCVFQL
jgi:hypothetical protein